MKSLNREILRLSIPSILANLTIPLVGIVDTAVAGHLPEFGGNSTAAFIGAISLGSMLLNLIYWSFGFLRTGTGGPTGQAFGQGDRAECSRILLRGLMIAGMVSVITLLLQWPLVKLALMVVKGSPEVESLATDYFLLRIWAAPATLSLMVFSGWFVGMQDSMSSMWKDLVVNFTNIAASVVLALGIGRWKGLGFNGIALGTVIAQYSGLAFCILTYKIKYGRKDSGAGVRGLVPGWSWLKGYTRMNSYLLGRSFFFIAIYLGFTTLSAGLGDMMLACGAIIMQLLMFFSYFIDGFAYAGEALTGRFIGEGNPEMLRKSVKYCFIWSIAFGVLFVGLYRIASVPVLKLLTSDGDVVTACGEFLPWLLLMPATGCAAFMWDGIYLGATATRGIFISMLGAAACFFACWYGGCALGMRNAAESGMHLLLAAYFAHLVFRTVYMTARYRRDILTR